MSEVKITVTEKNENKSLIRLYLRIFFHFLFIVVIFLTLLLIVLHLYDQYISGKVTDPETLAILKFIPCFITDWNILFQTIFLTMSLVYDIMEWLDRHDSPIGRKLKFWRDIIFSGLVVPLTMFVTTMFWTVYWIDRELVFPEVYDQLVPWWFNHCVHTNIAIVVLIETVLQARRHPTHFKLEIWLIGVAGVLYAIVYYSIYFFSHRWLYGVFGIMTWWQVCLYQILIWASTFFFYFIQYPVNRIFHREESDQQKQIVQESKNGIQNGAYREESSGIPENLVKLRSKSQIENSSF